MKNLQTSLPMEESWVDGKIEKFQAMPLGVSVNELNVSIVDVVMSNCPKIVTKFFFVIDSYLLYEDYTHTSHVIMNLIMLVLFFNILIYYTYEVLYEVLFNLFYRVNIESGHVWNTKIK